MKALDPLQSNFGRIFHPRCLHLVLALVALIVAALWVDDSAQGRFVVMVAQTAILIAAVAAVGRTAAP
jgi:putative copper export protein